MLSEENIRLIFGLKLKQMRTESDLSLAELSEKSGLSVSYLNEIEKGKKYPKTDKVAAIAEALNVPYDKLVSLKLTKNLAPIGELLTSGILDELPLDLFGIETNKLVELISNAPTKLNAFISTLIEIARNYDMKQEHFFFAALRSYQEMHENYFEDLEEKVKEFVDQYEIDIAPPVDINRLRQILADEYNYEITDNGLNDSPELQSLRSVLIPGEPNRLLINGELTETQKAFLLGKEIAYNYLELEERPYISTYTKVKSFDQVLNNFKASYFSVALLINEEDLTSELDSFFKSNKWDGNRFLDIMHKYHASPEMFFHRLTNILPRFFGLHNLFFLRFNNEKTSSSYHLTKELHLSMLHNPHGNETNEHYCRRWITLTILDKLARIQEKDSYDGPIIGIQRSRYVDSTNEYICLSIARPMAPTPDTNVSVTIGLLLNAELKRKMKFWNDEAITTRLVNSTCERCPLEDCMERAAPPKVLKKQEKIARQEKALQELYNRKSEIVDSDL